MNTAVTLATFVLACLGYGTSAVLYYLEIVRGGPASRPGDARSWLARIAPWLLGGAASLHAAYVVEASFVAHVCPVHSIHFFLSVASLLATTIYLIARRRYRIHALGVVCAPLGLVVTLGTFFLGSAGPQAPSPSGLFIGLHVFVNLVGVALFLLACGAAVMYLVQDKRLKGKKAMLDNRLPPLDALDKAVHGFLVAGFPLLTLGVATGTVWAVKLEQGAPDELLRFIFGYATWLLIAAVLLLRVLAGWRGRRSAYGTVAGFACALMVLLIYLVRPLMNGA